MITLQNVNKVFQIPDGEPLNAVSSASLQIDEGDIYGIIGFSGAGKSTLMRTINLLERPDSGKIIVNGQDMLALNEKELRKARMSIGMIFQHFNLLNNRTVFENVSFPLEIAGVPKSERKQRIEECLRIVGLEDKTKAYPAKLSGGQKQRVAIARALANKPKVLLCDEPTSSVDPSTTGSILAFLKEINERLGITIVIVTHEMNVIKSICNKVAVMEQGVVVEKFEMNDSKFVPKSNIAQFLFKNEIVLDKREVAYV
ncbi:D-methionine transport system ATP-binding protein [Paenibacillus sp. 1_12]|uniref:methionine ABC transporter ATP-binding protein n=1 Tax=Paenibacillus sp. 1_12 TaxID=1566278 RepID=UPI0008E1DD86|nr:ATP-binding cassette domain-containing protein [Paenibacillus sp. 1_12]SFL10308.1 D-methionine transport system ATP-binding protein [Paenibacillus sp. 1_12]